MINSNPLFFLVVLESVDASYPKVGTQDDVSPCFESQTYSEKRKFWEDITRKRDSYQQSESELSRASQLTFNESDTDYLQNIISEDDTEAMSRRSDILDEDANAPDMSECSVAEKAHYFEEQIQRELSKISSKRQSVLSDDLSRMSDENEAMASGSKDKVDKQERLKKDDQFLADTIEQVRLEKSTKVDVTKMDKVKDASEKRSEYTVPGKALFDEKGKDDATEKDEETTAAPPVPEEDQVKKPTEHKTEEDDEKLEALKVQAESEIQQMFITKIEEKRISQLQDDQPQTEMEPPTAKVTRRDSASRIPVSSSMVDKTKAPKSDESLKKSVESKKESKIPRKIAGKESATSISKEKSQEFKSETFQEATKTPSERFGFSREKSRDKFERNLNESVSVDKKVIATREESKSVQVSKGTEKTVLHEEKQHTTKKETTATSSTKLPTEVDVSVKCEGDLTTPSEDAKKARPQTLFTKTELKEQKSSDSGSIESFVAEERKLLMEESEARDIAETIVKSIEHEIQKRAIVPGKKTQPEEELEELYDDRLADDLTRKFEILMQNETAAMSGFSEETKEEEEEESLHKDDLPAGSALKLVERDITISPSSVSELEESDLPSNDLEGMSKKVSQVSSQSYYPESGESLDIHGRTKAPRETMFSEASGAKVLEVLEPEFRSRQDSMDVPSLEIDDVRLAQDSDTDHEAEAKDSYRPFIHESMRVDSLHKLDDERDITISPSSVSEDVNADLSEDRSTVSISRKKKPDSFEINSPPMVASKSKVPDLEIKAGDWLIGDDKIEITESLQPSEEFNRELERYQSPLREDFPGEPSDDAQESEFLDLDKDLIENELDVSCQELVDALKTEHDKKTPTMEVDLDVLRSQEQEIRDRLMSSLKKEDGSAFAVTELDRVVEKEVEGTKVAEQVPLLYKTPSSEDQDSPVAKPRKLSQKDSLEKDDEAKDPSKSIIPEPRITIVEELKDERLETPSPVGRSITDESGALLTPQPVPRRRHKAKGPRVTSDSDADLGSSSESSQYQSCDYDSRPSSSDVEALQSAVQSGTFSEYETALTSMEHSSRGTSQDYQTAASSLSSRESNKSLSSLSSGHLGSIDSTSELSETLVASDAEMDKDELDDNLDNVLEEDKEADSEVPFKMKRSCEMIFQQTSQEQTSDVVPTALERMADLKTTEDLLQPELTYSPERKLGSFVLDDDNFDMTQTSMGSLLQQASMSTSSTSAVSLETVIDKDADDRRSPDSDDFELVDKPDIIDDFVVVEEVGREAEEFDAEGKSIRIGVTAPVKTFDREVENLLTDSQKEKLAKQQTALKSTDLFEFESEESPPQASNPEDQYPSSYSDEEQYEGGKKWPDGQYQQDPRMYDIEYDRGPLEDIKEEEVTDFEAGSSRFGSLGSHKESIGSVGSMRGSFGSTPEYDAILGKRYLTKPTDHDNVSLSSLQEFEHLENAIAMDQAKKLQCGSQDSKDSSSTNGSLPRKYVTSKSSHGDDVSLSSLKDFEGLETACREAHMIELRAREEQDLLDHESPENRYKLEMARVKAETSATGSVNPSTSGSDDYEKRIREIDEIIRIAQANVEKLERQDDTGEDISQIEALDVEKIAASVEVRNVNAMETSTDSLELEDNLNKENLMCRSSDSLEMKTTLDYPSLSYSDSLNNMRGSQQDSGDKFGASRRISSDSLELPDPRDEGQESNIPRLDKDDGGGSLLGARLDRTDKGKSPETSGA